MVVKQHSGNMPAQQAAVAGGGQGQQEPQKKSSAIFGILRMIAMWYMFKTFFGGGSQKKLSREEMFAPHFPKGTSLDMSVYLSESPYFRDFTGSKPIWQEADVQLGLAAERKLNITYYPSQVRHSFCFPNHGCSHPQPLSARIVKAASVSQMHSSYSMPLNICMLCRAGCPEQRLCLLACLLCTKRPCFGSQRFLLPEQHSVWQEPW